MRHGCRRSNFKRDDKDRFVVFKNALVSKLGSYRLTGKYIKQNETLSDDWWDQAYKGNIRKPGQHLANRAMALSTSIVDLLLLGDNDIDRLIPGTINFAADLDSDARTRKEQAALYFFMLSHFVADACMPCHCDGRDLADYSKGLHNKLEKHWSRKVGGTFDDKYLMHTNMTSNKILKEARKIDTEFNITFKNSNHVPRIKSKDLWLEIINCCRAAFALNSIIAHPDDYPYDVPDLRAPFAVVFAEDHDAKLKGIDRAVIHDAVLNVAMAWKDIWKKAFKT